MGEVKVRLQLGSDLLMVCKLSPVHLGQRARSEVMVGTRCASGSSKRVMAAY